MSTAEGRTVEVNGISLYVEDHGSGTPVLLIHGWPDSSYLWRHQIPFLTGHGFRAIAPDMRGFGRSGRPPSVSDYALANDWAWLRRFSRGDGDQERCVRDLSRPGALTASLNWYRANLAPRMPGPAPDLPPVRVPTLGIWSTNDHYLDGERLEKSADCVEAPWRYEVIEGASHWIPLDAPDRLNELLLDWLD